ncbi:MAG: flagellar basal body L-ring protein FlgH [Armatimonadota bacterium]|nr:flagellar basal body L-ring protein FlgH [Armatimonadota bacterium]
MPRSIPVAFALGLSLAASTPACYAEPGETQFFGSLYEDFRARQPGDILFVVISESARASHSATRENQKSTSAQAGPGTAWLDFIPGLSYGGEMQHAAGGRSQRRDLLSARVATTVTGVTPAGNLTIEGERRVRVNRDWQTIRLVGEVRPTDVRPDNTVLSHHVANASIEYEGPDPGKPHGRVGLITRILGWLF